MDSRNHYPIKTPNYIGRDLCTNARSPLHLVSACSALYHCKYLLACATIHESSEILTTVTVNYRSQVTDVVPQGFEPRLFWTKTRRVANYTIGQFVGRDGFEPPYLIGTDLQSAGFNHSPTFQYLHASKDSNPDEWIWNPLCYQLHQRRVLSCHSKYEYIDCPLLSATHRG
jgi:hypothetical protein